MDMERANRQAREIVEQIESGKICFEKARVIRDLLAQRLRLARLHRTAERQRMNSGFFAGAAPSKESVEELAGLVRRARQVIKKRT